MKHAFVATAFACAISAASASPYFSEVLPNTADDASLEYFALRNSACVPVTLSGYSVVDASGKSYALPDDTLFSTGSERKYFRPESKVTLNNENETLSLFDPFGSLVDSFSYPSSSKGVPVVRGGVSVPACAVPEAAVPSSEDAPDQTSGPSELPVESPDPVPPDSEPLDDPVSDVPTDDPTTPSEEIPAVPSETGDPASGTQEGALMEGSQTGSEISVSTGSVFPDSSDSGSGPAVPTAAVPMPGGSAPTSPALTSKASPERLTLVDSNADGRFDWAEIRYSENLSGTADPNEYLLYSNTGGLYQNRVPTVAGYFSRAEISGTILRLAFSGTTLQKTAMRVDASTSSEFRIKSAAISSLRTSSSGLPVVALGLTTSFSGYARDRIEFVPAFPEASEETESSVSPVSESAEGPVSSPSASGSSANAEDVGMSAKKSASPAVKTVAPIDVSALEIVPSSGVDLLPS